MEILYNMCTIWSVDYILNEESFPHKKEKLLGWNFKLKMTEQINFFHVQIL